MPLLIVSPAHAQDFAPAEPGGPSDSAAALLENGLATPGAYRAEALATSWLGVPGLVSRAVCAAGSCRSVRVAAGWSETGDPELGWMSAGLALGSATRVAGAALRAVGRRELDATGASRVGLEAGGGAWLEAAAGVHVWARAPQLVTAGLAPPLARGLAIGVAADHEGVSAWFEREAPARRSDESGTHAAGVSLDLESARVWVEGRGRPLRAGFGVSAHTRHLVIGVRALAHPELGDTVTLSLSIPVREPPP